MIRVVLVDDQDLVRAGFRVLIDSAADIDVVGEAGNGEEAIAIVETERPDVVLMDIRMPGMDGLEATKKISSQVNLSDVRILILTTFDLDEYVHEALRAGASGFLLKDTSPVQLLDAIRVVASGDALLAPSITKRLIEEFTAHHGTGHPGTAELELLTQRETEVLTLVGRGLSNSEIAEELFISPTTSKTHVSRIMMKLQARDRAQLVVIAYESGLVRPNST